MADGVVDQPVAACSSPASTASACCRSPRPPPRACGAAHAVGLRRGGGRAARPDRRPRGLAGADGVAPRRDPRAGAPGGRARPAALAQRVQRARARPARRRARATRGRARPGDRRRRPAPARAGRRHARRPRVAAIRRCARSRGGFGVVLGFAHDWADREATLRSWGSSSPATSCPRSTATSADARSADYVTSNKDELMAGAVGAIMEAIGKHKGATEAAAETARLIVLGPPSPVR